MKKKEKKTSYIYFLQAGYGGPIKIGCSINPDIRLGYFQLWCPTKLVLLGFISGSFGDEKRIHAHFRDERLKGERFNYSRRLVMFINRSLKSNRINYEATRFKEIAIGNDANFSLSCILSKHKISQTELSKYLGVTRAAVSLWCCSKRIPWSFMDRIQEFFISKGIQVSSEDYTSLAV